MSERLRDNPFFVLGLSPDCSRAEVERAGARLLGLTRLGAQRAATHDSPLGPQPRSEQAVRQALAALRDPRRRMLAELWARAPARPQGAEPEPGWPEALAELGLAP